MTVSGAGVASGGGGAGGGAGGDKGSGGASIRGSSTGRAWANLARLLALFCSCSLSRSRSRRRRSCSSKQREHTGVLAELRPLAEQAPYPSTLTLSQSGLGDILPSLRHQTEPSQGSTELTKHKPGPHHWGTHSLGQEVGEAKDRGARSGRLG